jgi:hypothetical protein
LTDIPTVGHNQPPEPTPIERGAELVANCNRWSAEVPKISDAEQAGRAQAFVDQLRLTTADVEAEWKKEREPFDQEIVLLRVKYRDPLLMLGIALDKMKALTTDWLDREKARISRETAERKRLAAEAEVAARLAREQAARSGATVEAEAAALQAEDEAEALRAAALKPVARPQIRGEFSPRAMSLRVSWRAVITDEQKALKHFAKHPAIRAAALAAIVELESKHARKVKDAAQAPPGVRFDKEEKAA